MKTIKNIIRAELISMLGKKRSLIISAAAIFVLAILISAVLLPVFFAFCVLVYALLSVSLLTAQEKSLNTTQIFSVLPIDRKSFVLSRFVLICGSVSALSLIFYILMRLCVSTGVYEQLVETEYFFNSMQDTISPSMSELGVYNSLFSFLVMCSLITSSSKLRRYFKNGISEKKNSLIRTTVKVVIILFILAAAGALFGQLLSMKIGFSIFKMIVAFIDTLAQPMHGLILSIFFIIIGLSAVCYNFVCAVIEYEAREI